MDDLEKPGIDRRSFIKRAAATGGITVFAAPVVQTVVAGAARAQVNGATPAPSCIHSEDEECAGAEGCMETCTGTGSGLGGACAAICDEGCPVQPGASNCRLCVSDDYCDPNCYESSGRGEVEFVC